ALQRRNPRLQRGVLCVQSRIFMLELTGRFHPSVDSDSPPRHQADSGGRVNWPQLRPLDRNSKKPRTSSGATWAVTLLGLIGVGDEAALHRIGGARDLGEQGGDQAAGAALGGDEPHVPRAEGIEQARRFVMQRRRKHGLTPLPLKIATRSGAPRVDAHRRKIKRKALGGNLKPPRAFPPAPTGRRAWSGSGCP